MLYARWIAPIMIAATTCSYAQEYNIGVHLNPVLVTPLLDEYSNTNILNVSPMRVNVGAGLNLNIRTNKWSIETGANGILKTIQLSYKYKSQTTIGNTTTKGKAALKATGYSASLEIPLQIGYLLHHHEKKTTYDVFGFVGAGYELNESQGFSSSGYSYASSSAPNANGNVKFTNNEPKAGITTSWVNIIAGFKINAILRHVGLVDYGLSFHYPLQNAGVYSVTALITDGSYNEQVNVNFSPRLAYTNIKICYYFLNLDKHITRKRYRFSE